MMRVPMIALLGCALVTSAGPARVVDTDAGGSVPTWEEWAGPPPEGIMSWPPVLVTPDLRRLRGEGEITMFGPAAAARRVRGKRDRWLVDVTWFGWPGDSTKIYSFDEVDALQRSGLVNDHTIFDLMTCRFQARARDLTAVKGAVAEHLRRGPPRVVRMRVGEALRAPGDTIASSH